MNELVTTQQFTYFLSAMTAGLGGAWLVYDAVNLLRMRRAPRDDAHVRDKLFGYVMGVVIGAIGVVGVLKHHL